MTAYNKATRTITQSSAIGGFCSGPPLKRPWAQAPTQIIQTCTCYRYLQYSCVWRCTSFQRKKERVHFARFIKNGDSLLGTEAPIDILALSEATEARYEIFECIKDVEYAPDGLFFKFSGKDSRASDSVPSILQTIYALIYLTRLLHF